MQANPALRAISCGLWRKASSQAVGALVQREIVRAASAETLLTTVELHARLLDKSHVLTALHRLSRFGRSDLEEAVTKDRRFLSLLAVVARSARTYNTRDLALAMSSLAGLRANAVIKSPCEKVWQSLSEALVANGCASGRDIAQCLSASAAARFIHQDLMQLACQPSSIGLLDCRSLASLISAMASCRHSPPSSCLAQVHDHMEQTLGLARFHDKDIAGIARSMALIANDTSVALIEKVSQEAIRRESMSCQAVSSIMWACARVQLRDRTLFEALALQASKSISDALPQHLTMCVWALASTQQHLPHFFEDVAAYSVPQAECFNEQEVGNTMRSFAQVRIFESTMYTALTEHAHTSLGVNAMSNHTLSNIAWSLARFRRTLQAWPHRSYEALLSAIACEVCSGDRPQQLSPQHFSNILWAFTSLNHQDTPQLLEGLSDALAQRIPTDFSVQNTANILCAIGKAHWSDSALLAAIIDGLLAHLDLLQETELVGTAWAAAELHAADNGKSVPTFLEAVAKEVAARPIETLAPKSIVTLLVAFATCGIYPQGTFLACLQESARCLHPGQDDLSLQIWLATLAYLLEVPQGQSGLAAREDLFHAFPHLQALSQAVIAQPLELQLVSSTQEHAAIVTCLSEQLHQLGITHSCGESVEKALFIDVALPQVKVAIEVHGESNFLHDPASFVGEVRVFNGRTSFKSRLLWRLGWQVISIQQHVWAQLHSLDEQCLFLEAALNDARALTETVGTIGQILVPQAQAVQKIVPSPCAQVVDSQDCDVSGLPDQNGETDEKVEVMGYMISSTVAKTLMQYPLREINPGEQFRWLSGAMTQSPTVKFGKILRSGFGPYSSKYRVIVGQDGADRWYEKNLCWPDIPT